MENDGYSQIDPIFTWPLLLSKLKLYISNHGTFFPWMVKKRLHRILHLQAKPSRLVANVFLILMTKTPMCQAPFTIQLAYFTSPEGMTVILKLPLQ